MPLDEFFVEGGIGIRGAVCGNQQLCAVKIRCACGNQLNLHRPLGQAADRLCIASRSGFFVCNRSGLTSRTSAGECHPFCLHFFLHPSALIFLHCLFIIRCRFALHKGNRGSGAGRQAIAQTIAVVIAHQLRLSVYHSDCAFVTSGGTGTAAIAFILINFNDSSFHNKNLLAFLFSL